MGYTVFTITGCARCKILKQCLSDNGFSFDEKNMLEEGKEDFQKFYAQNRKSIVRGLEGIEFPILISPAGLHQGLAATVAQVLFGKKLDGFVSVGSLHKEWVDGFHISGGDPQYIGEFIGLLTYIKERNMKLQVETDGRNPAIFERVLSENLASVVLLNLLGPARAYSSILNLNIDPADIRRSLEFIIQAPEFKIYTKVTPQLTPADIGDAAQWISEATGSAKTPFYLKTANSEEPVNLFPYRSAARRHLVFAEIEQPS
jgi:pyruvate formate lyase activating enzyme